MVNDSVELRSQLKTESRIEKFRDLQNHLDEKQNKYGKASTLRMAIDMAYDRLKELEKEREDKAVNWKELTKELKAYTEAENI